MFKKNLICLALTNAILYHSVALAEPKLTPQETERAIQTRALVEKHLLETWGDKCVFLMMYNDLSYYVFPQVPMMNVAKCIATLAKTEYGIEKGYYAFIEIDAKNDLYKKSYGYYGMTANIEDKEAVREFFRIIGDGINWFVYDVNKKGTNNDEGVKILIDEFNIVKPNYKPPADNKNKPIIDKETELLKYRELIKTKIMQEWILPAKYSEKKYKKLNATVDFKINEDGEITTVEIKQGSGDKSFDSSCLYAVRRASPFPLPSQNIKELILNDFFSISFSPDVK